MNGKVQSNHIPTITFIGDIPIRKKLKLLGVSLLVLVVIDTLGRFCSFLGPTFTGKTCADVTIVCGPFELHIHVWLVSTH